MATERCSNHPSAAVPDPISCLGSEAACILFDQRITAHDVENKDKVLPLFARILVHIVSVEDFLVIQHQACFISSAVLFRVVWYPEAVVALS